MKKTLITTAVAIALGASFGVQSDEVFSDYLEADVTTTQNATAGNDVTATNAAKDSYNSSLSGSSNNNISHGLNDVNSQNTITIGEDGVVAFAQDLDQAIASSDLVHTIGDGGAAGSGTAENLVLENSARSVAALSPATNISTGNSYTQANAIEAGSFNNFGGTSSASQNTGSMTAVGQSIVVQSNGGV